jgi:hypothetical protein
MTVTLAWHEVLMAAQIGLQREAECLKRLSRDRRPNIRHSWDQCIRGALGEMAACKALGVFWDGSVNTFKTKPDIPPNIQVRTRPADCDKVKYDLIVRSSDKDTDTFVLVAGQRETFVVRGWITGKLAKNQSYSRNYDGHEQAWFVPRDALRPIEELVAIIHGGRN